MLDSVKLELLAAAYKPIFTSLHPPYIIFSRRDYRQSNKWSWMTQ